jgi:hypothetical protein
VPLPRMDLKPPHLVIVLRNANNNCIGSTPSLNSIFLCIALSCSLLLHLQPSYNNFVGSIDENVSSCSRVCGLVYLWSAACEPYCPQYRFTELVF